MGKAFDNLKGFFSRNAFFIVLILFVSLGLAFKKGPHETEEYQLGYADGEVDGYSAGKEDGMAQGRQEICDEIETRFNPASRDILC